MRRDIGNEVIVAIVAVGVIAFAVIFAIVLSVSNANQSTAFVPTIAGQSAATRQPTVIFTLVPSDTVAPTENPVVVDVVAQTSTSIFLTQNFQLTLGTPRSQDEHPPEFWETLAGATLSATTRPSNTVVPTETTAPTSTIVEALIVPSDTASPSPSPTDQPTETVTATERPTNTVIPTERPSDTPTDRPTNTTVPTDRPTNTATWTPTDTLTNTARPTDTVAPTNTETPRPTQTPRPTDTVAPTNTETLRPTNTPIPTDTATVRPTDTITPTNTVTDTPRPTLTSIPTDTSTVRPTATIAPTSTLTDTPRPTNTPFPTETPQPTNTSTPKLTNTPLPTDTPRPTLTPTNTVIPTDTIAPSPTNTNTPVATGTPFPTRTPRAVATVTGTEMPMSGECAIPVGWVPYLITSIDTIYALAVASSSSVGELRAGNCLEGGETPQVGDIIALPRTPAQPIPTFEPVIPDTALLRVGCSFPGAVITSPLAGETLSGVFEVIGTASLNNFAYYRVEVRPDAATIFNLYERSETPVVGGVLAEINTSLYGDGLHWIRLTVLQPNGEFPTPCVIPVVFE